MISSRSTMHSAAGSLPYRVLLLLAMEVCTAAATKPIADCASLARASLGPNVTVLSAQETTVATTTTADDHLAAGTCTFEKDVDVGQPDTIVASFKGLVDEKACCAACYANPKCVVAAILPAGVGPGPGCWLKTGAGSTYAAKGKKICRTNRSPPKAAGYCLVKVLVQPAINIWVGLPSDGSYNDRFMALGGGGFVGSVSAPTKAVQAGYAGATTDTGHKGSSGSFGMLSPGVPDALLRTDFGWRSEHMMAVVSKQLIEIFYGKQPELSYWNGCSTGGRQGQAMAQRFPDDYQGTINSTSSCHAEWANQHAIYVWGSGILAGAPAIHFEKLGLGQTWPQVPMLMENGGKSIGPFKLEAALAAAVKACDPLDGVIASSFELNL
jgi:hypothetical protein